MPPFNDICAFLGSRSSEPFTVPDALDARRHLARRFPPELPLLLKHYSFPGYRKHVGASWMHWHGYYELILPFSGAGTFCVGDQSVDFAPGDLLVVDTLKLHGISHLSGPHSSLVIFFPDEAVAPPGGNPADRSFLAPLCGRPDDVPPLLSSRAPAAADVHAAILGLVRAWFSDDSPVDRYLAAKVHLLAALYHLRKQFGLRREFADDLRDRQERQARLRNVLDLLATRFAEPLAQPEIAAIAGMSPSLFRDFFKRTTGCTFAEYLRNLRLSRAEELLRTGSSSVAEIAAEVGLADQSYLHRCFKARYGCAPLEYRKAARRGDGASSGDFSKS